MLRCIPVLKMIFFFNFIKIMSQIISIGTNFLNLVQVSKNMNGKVVCSNYGACYIQEVSASVPNLLEPQLMRPSRERSASFGAKLKPKLGDIALLNTSWNTLQQQVLGHMILLKLILCLINSKHCNIVVLTMYWFIYSAQFYDSTKH